MGDGQIKGPKGQPVDCPGTNLAIFVSKWGEGGVFLAAFRHLSVCFVLFPIFKVGVSCYFLSDQLATCGCLVFMWP